MALAYLTFLLTSLLGCETNTELFELTGDLKGKVRVNDQRGLSLPAESAGVEVLVEDLDESFTAITDENGEYLISGISTGTYKVSFSKEGFGYHEIKYLRFIGGEVAQTANVWLLQESTLKVENINWRFVDPTWLSITGDFVNTATTDFDSETIPKYVFAFISKDSQVSSTNYDQFQSAGFNNWDQQSVTEFELSIPIGSDYFVSGEEYYISLYASHSYSSFYDVEKEIQIFPNLVIPSNTQSILIP